MTRIAGFVQNCSISIDLAIELVQSYSKPSTYVKMKWVIIASGVAYLAQSYSAGQCKLIVNWTRRNKFHCDVNV